MISVEVNKKWQKLRNSESKGRHLFQIQEYVGNEKKDVIISRLRIGHTALNHSLYKIGKHESGKCDKCGQLETVMHIIFECSAYERERVQLMQKLGRLGVDHISLKVLLGNGSRQSRVHSMLFKYLEKHRNHRYNLVFLFFVFLIYVHSRSVGGGNEPFRWFAKSP